MPLKSDFQKLAVDGYVTVIEIDARKFGGDFIRIHGMKHGGNIIWQGQVYEPIGVAIGSTERRNDGNATAPTLTLANNVGGIVGAISAYCLRYKDFANCKVRIISTLVEYLDAANFDEGNPNASNEAIETHWFIEQKVSENPEQVVFELSDPLNHEGRKLPGRIITQMCEWAVKGEYRGESCGYTGTKYFNKKDIPVLNITEDVCAGYINSCKLRFGETAELPHGGFPTAGII